MLTYVSMTTGYTLASQNTPLGITISQCFGQDYPCHTDTCFAASGRGIGEIPPTSVPI